ncbi:hypothetical protein BDV95DRAFT_663201 [Massariosphaeria phaeospora]|uniref:Uncharacterized protein n=1 Tax=Massariosphaeria phaeospora TaxID=100035 RepID=A0A7C8IJH4_9PLEO|nr:hypothetical protein BDV95DRAFT_663201 [Massariosphaeria phaeospora]
MPLELTPSNDRAPVEDPAPTGAPTEPTEDDDLSDVFNDAGPGFGDVEGANETAAVEEIAPTVEERPQSVPAGRDFAGRDLAARQESVREIEASQRERAIRDRTVEPLAPPSLDFELLLVAAALAADAPAAAGSAPALSQRLRIATNIQEQGLANTIEARVVSNGYAMEIRDE